MANEGPPLALVNEWLTEYEQLEPSQIKSYCVQNEDNHEITSALFAVLGERDRFTEVSILDTCRYAISNHHHHVHPSTNNNNLPPSSCPTKSATNSTTSTSQV